jgi:hypothetical protein
MLDLSEPPRPSVPAPLPWDAHRYLDVLHPACGFGRISGLSMQGDRVTAHTWRHGNLPIAADILTEQEAYIGMNRFYGPRGRARLATLNAVWLDLDTYRIASLALLPRAELYRWIASTIEQAGLPAPSLIVDSGRGLYVIWLLDGGAAAALPRWKALMKALVGWGKPLGADPACVDAARVLRLPGSWHEGAGRQAGQRRRRDRHALRLRQVRDPCLAGSRPTGSRQSGTATQAPSIGQIPAGGKRPPPGAAEKGVLVAGSPGPRVAPRCLGRARPEGIPRHLVACVLLRAGLDGFGRRYS